MRLTVLGSGTSLPDPHRGPAGLLLQTGQGNWLIDGGSGTLQRLAKMGVDPTQLDGGFYSHRHPDHCADLVPLLFAMHVPPGRSRDYPVYAGTGFEAYLQGLRAVYGAWIQPAGGSVVVHELPLDGPGALQLGQLTVTTAPANHGAGALHLRFDAGGRSVVFSGDTGPSDNLVRLARSADLLVTECAGPIAGHLDAHMVADIVRKAQPKEVWLTHLYGNQDRQAVRQIVADAGAPTRLADDLDVWGQVSS
jgi:ribonuclease BN (tRNA processing enzyme)